MGSEREGRSPGDPVRVVRSVFRAASPFPVPYARTVIVDCSDGRFRESVVEFLKQVFGLPCADGLQLPGGTAALHVVSAGSWSEVEVMRAKLKTLVEEHHSSRILLFAHEGCMHYLQRFAGRDPEGIRQRVLSDLATVAGELRRQYPHTEVRAFYKRPEKGHIVFDEVTP